MDRYSAEYHGSTRRRIAQRYRLRLFPRTGYDEAAYVRGIHCISDASPYTGKGFGYRLYVSASFCEYALYNGLRVIEFIF